MNLTEAIIHRIKYELDKNKMTQYALSMASGVCQATISAILKGKVKSVQTNTLYDICCGFNISIREFFDTSIFDSENILD